MGLTGSLDDADSVAEICERFRLGGTKSAYYQGLLRERVTAKTKRRKVRNW
ncbi:hypothetical protein ABZW30_45070 [Kitasatospora sp. NPDC004669]|uniref:hypothetical protein n=1 Tax=Kitasatospora sp. NPDC004669 TaxID=3154555 RepID=UPI0033B62B88